MNYLLRRRKLGKTSCAGIRDHSETNIRVFRNDGYEQVQVEGRNKYVKTDLPEAEYIFRWGCTDNLPKHAVTVNEAKAIHWVTDKAESRMSFYRQGLSMPTFLSGVGLLQSNYDLDIGWVIRPRVHAQGRNLIVIYSEEELNKALDKHENNGYYISMLIKKTSEYRVFVCQGRVVWIAQKTPGNPDQIAWNVAQGGRFDNVRWGNWNEKVCQYAVGAMAISGLDFGGVDVMLDAEGTPYVLEINSAPSQTSEYRQSCVAKAFDYIIQNGKDNIPLGDRNKGYRRFIHPAIDPEAIIGD